MVDSVCFFAAVESFDSFDNSSYRFIVAIHKEK